MDARIVQVFPRTEEGSCTAKELELCRVPLVKPQFVPDTVTLPESGKRYPWEVEDCCNCKLIVAPANGLLVVAPVTPAGRFDAVPVHVPVTGGT